MRGLTGRDEAGGRDAVAGRLSLGRLAGRSAGRLGAVLFSFGRAAEDVPRDASVRVLFRVDAAWPRLDSVDRGFAARDSAGREFAVRELVGLEFEFAAREFAAPGFADRALAAPEVRFWLPERLATASLGEIFGGW